MWKKLKRKVKSALKTVKETRITTVAGAWVYYFIMALVPLTFLLITAFSVFGIDIANEIINKLPEEFVEGAELILLTAQKVSKGITALFIFTVIFSSYALINQMTKDGEFIYGKKRHGKEGFFRILWVLFAVISLFLVFLIAGLFFAFGNSVFSYFNGLSLGKNFLLILFFLFVILFCYIVIIILNKFISPVRLPTKITLLGSLVSLFITVIGTIGFTVYIRYVNSYNAFYGSLASVIIFMLWAYIIMIGLSVGAVVSMKLYENEKKREFLYSKRLKRDSGIIL